MATCDVFLKKEWILSPSGALYIDADPSGVGEFLPSFNAMTLTCIEHNSGSLTTPQLFVNVDILAPIDFIRHATNHSNEKRPATVTLSPDYAESSETRYYWRKIGDLSTGRPAADDVTSMVRIALFDQQNSPLLVGIQSQTRHTRRAVVLLYRLLSKSRRN